MNRRTRSNRANGSVLVLALILLAIVSVVILSAFQKASSNLRSVGNIQARSEAMAAANRAFEQVISGSFLSALNTSVSISVDINNDGTPDYTVTVAIPKCPMKVAKVAQDAPSGYENMGGGQSAGTYAVDWELIGTVADTSSGASVTVHEGVRVPMDEADFQMYIVPCGLTVYSS